MVKRVAILGGGITALAAAWFLKKKEKDRVEITILEKSPRLGGWIQTVNQNGFLFELGPRSIRTGSLTKEMFSLLCELGLEKQIILPSDSAQDRYLYEQGSLKKVPRSFWQIPFSSLSRGWIKALYRDFSHPRIDSKDESIATFFNRHLGVKWTNRLIDPFISGIFAGDINKLSVQSCFPFLVELESTHGSLLKGVWKKNVGEVESVNGPSAPFFSFKTGMESIIHALAHNLDSKIELNYAVQQLDFASDSVKIISENGHCLEVDEVISTVPYSVLAKIIPQLDLSEKEVESTSVVVVNIGFKGLVLDKKGFGYLVPSQENEPILGCVWDSIVFPCHDSNVDQTRLTIMMGGAHQPQISKWSDDQIVSEVRKILARHLDIQSDPEEILITRAQEAIPQFQVGHGDLLKKLQGKVADLDRLTVTGNWMSGVSVTDCVTAAAKKYA